MGRGFLPSLKGPEAGRLQAQWEVCAWGGEWGREEAGMGTPSDPQLDSQVGGGPPCSHALSVITGQEAQTQTKAEFQEAASGSQSHL